MATISPSAIRRPNGARRVCFGATSFFKPTTTNDPGVRGGVAGANAATRSSYSARRYESGDARAGHGMAAPVDVDGIENRGVDRRRRGGARVVIWAAIDRARIGVGVERMRHRDGTRFLARARAARAEVGVARARIGQWDERRRRRERHRRPRATFDDPAAEHTLQRRKDRVADPHVERELVGAKNRRRLARERRPVERREQRALAGRIPGRERSLRENGTVGRDFDLRVDEREVFVDRRAIEARRLSRLERRDHHHRPKGDHVEPPLQRLFGQRTAHDERAVHVDHVRELAVDVGPIRLAVPPRNRPPVR